MLLLREYYGRLISDVVTGKLHVREAAPWPLDEAEEAEPLDTEAVDQEEVVGADECCEVLEEADA